MKMVYRVADGRTVEVEGATQADLLRELAGAVEVFGEPCCGVCGETAIVPIARHAQKFEFFEWGCTNPQCGARLSFGVRNDQSGRLFPKRRLDANGKPDMDHGTAGDHNGWTRYPRDTDAGSAGSAGPRTPPPTRPAPPASADAEPIDPGALLTAAQREAIGTALRVSGIGRQTFLAWCGYASPEVIPQHAYRKLLAAAQKPPKDLLSQAAR